MAIVIPFTGMVYLRAEKNVSTRGVLVREGIGYITRLPSLSGGKMMITGADLVENLHYWKAPKGYSLHSFEENGLYMELLSEDNSYNDNIILHFHGGGYIIGFMDVYRHIALRYCKASSAGESGGASVLSIDYKTAPKYTFPAALDDAMLSWEWLLSNGYNPENIIIAGDSAGGNLALSLTAKLRDQNRPLPKALVLMSPWADMAAQGESYIYNQNLDPIFGNKNGVVNNNDKSSNPYAKDTNLKDPYLSPVYGDFDNFPAMLIQVGSHEILESDSLTVAQKAQNSGVDVKLTRYEGMFHVFQLTGSFLPESKKAWREVSQFLKNQFA
ncbi:MAG: alpha/beta hydrolase [Bacillota bacterium]